jgi:hypothetical protein
MAHGGTHDKSDTSRTPGQSEIDTTDEADEADERELAELRMRADLPDPSFEEGARREPRRGQRGLGLAVIGGRRPAHRRGSSVRSRTVAP